ncbi:DUF5958 family protein [Kitasatospora sp. NPDC050543]|uniref:DUF5958 family protein n=1 Tax=Kitasatospora sp. NPDC050543 TaxID=3364054 RepID=UPI0037A54B09
MHERVEEFLALEPESGRLRLRELADECLRAGTTDEDAADGIARAGLRPDQTPAVLLTRPADGGLGGRLRRIADLPESELAQAFRLLVALLALADARRAERRRRHHERVTELLARGGIGVLQGPAVDAVDAGDAADPAVRAEPALPADAAGVLPCPAACWDIGARPEDGLIHESVPRSSPQLIARVNARWHQLAAENGLFAADGDFLLGVEGPEAELQPEWIRVRLLSTWDPAGAAAATGLLGSAPGRPEFTTAALDGSVVLQVTTNRSTVDVYALPHPRRAALFATT